jgi:hypothetical protein
MATTQGAYKGQTIYAGSDEYVQQQMKAIDSGTSSVAPLGTQERSTQLLSQAQALLNPKPIPATTTQPPQQAVTITPPPTTPIAPPDIKTIEQGIASQFAGQEKPLQDREATLEKTIADILLKQTTEGTRTAELENQVGIPDLAKNLTEIQNQIRALNAEAFTQTQNQEGRLAPTFAIAGEQERIQRLNSARQYGLAATAQAMQGSLALARDSVDRAIKAEFGGIESQLKYYEFLYNNNRDKLIQIDEKKAKALELALGERTSQIAEQKETRTQIYNLALGLAQNGASSALISQLLNSPNLDTALQAAVQSGLIAPTEDGGFTLSAGQTRYDANGNVIAARADKPGGGGFGTGISFGTATEANIFNGIVNKYNADPIIQASNRANALDFYIQQIKANPASAGNQLNLIYSYIKGLDTDSAVREGEIELVRSIQSYAQSAQNAIERITQGKPVAAQTALELASGAEKIVEQLRAAAQRQQQKYTSQANANPGSISNAWQQYLSGSQTTSQQPEQVSYTSLANEADNLFPDEQPATGSLWSKFTSWLGI